MNPKNAWSILPIRKNGFDLCPGKTYLLVKNGETFWAIITTGSMESIAEACHIGQQMNFTYETGATTGGELVGLYPNTRSGERSLRRHASGKTILFATFK